MYTKEEQEKINKAHERNVLTHKRIAIKNKLIIAKAKEKGITVSEAEVDAYLKTKV
jgi:hypothetical protein